VFVEAVGPPGGDVRFAALPDGRLVVADGGAPPELSALAGSLSARLDPPYRARAVRRGPNAWAVGARRIDVIELPEATAGETLELTVLGRERTLRVDGMRAFAEVPALERAVAGRHRDFVAVAERLAGDSWELQVSPL